MKIARRQPVARTVATAKLWLVGLVALTALTALVGCATPPFEVTVVRESEELPARTIYWVGVTDEETTAYKGDTPKDFFHPSYDHKRFESRLIDAKNADPVLQIARPKDRGVNGFVIFAKYPLDAMQREPERYKVIYNVNQAKKGKKFRLVLAADGIELTDPKGNSPFGVVQP